MTNFQFTEILLARITGMQLALKMQSIQVIQVQIHLLSLLCKLMNTSILELSTEVSLLATHFWFHCEYSWNKTFSYKINGYIFSSYQIFNARKRYLPESPGFSSPQRCSLIQVIVVYLAVRSASSACFENSWIQPNQYRIFEIMSITKTFTNNPDIQKDRASCVRRVSLTSVHFSALMLGHDINSR